MSNNWNVSEQRERLKLTRSEKEKRLLEEIGTEKPKTSKRKKVAIGTAAGVLGATAVLIPTAKYAIDNQKYHITMKVQGVHYETHRMEVKKGTLIQNLKKFDITGYNFVGFYKDEACTKPYQAEDKVTKSSTVYCKYEPIVYTINYKTNQKEYVINADVQVEYGNNLIFSVYSQPGYTLENSVVKVNGELVFPNEYGQYIISFVDKDIQITVEEVRELDYVVYLNVGNSQVDIKILDKDITLYEVIEENAESLIDLALIQNPNTYTKEQLINLSTEDLFKLLVYDIYEDENCTKKLDLTKKVISYNVDDIEIHTKLATLDKLTFAENYVSAKDKNITGELVIPQAYLNNGEIVEVKTTGRYGFQLCTGLTSLKVPYGITSIGFGSFFKCSNITEIELPNSLTLIEEGAFAQSGLIDVIVPNSVKQIDGYAFAYSNNLKSFKFGSDFEIFGNFIFARNSNLESIEVDENNSKFHAAGNCLIETETKTLVLGIDTSIIPDDGSVEIIRGSSFEYLEKLTAIKIPDAVKELGEFAFNNCAVLTDIEIGSGLTTVVRAGFYECSNITNIKVDENNEVFYVAGNSLIHRENKTLVLGSLLSEIPADGSVVTIGIDAFRGSNITQITIPNTITHINTQAFEGCLNLSELKIPSSVTKLGLAVFAECDNLNVIIDENNTTFKMDGNCIINMQTGELKQGFYNSVIPADGSVKFIGECAFYQLVNLKSILIPESVTSIKRRAFYNCTGLTEIIIPSSVTSINNLAFEGCTNLKKVVFEESEGWFVADESNATEGTEILSTNLSNQTMAAAYLTSTYYDKFWKRNV